MPDAQGKLTAGDPGYVAPVGGAPGIINSGTNVAVDAPGAPPTSSSGVQPTTLVTPAPAALTADQTTQGRVKGIIDENSPLMQQAMARAAAKANERGLLNSSLAVGAGQAAVLDAATPIATADAQNATQLALGNNQTENSRYTAGLASNTQLQIQAADAASKQALQSDDNAFKTRYQTADTAARKELQADDNAFKTTYQTADTAARRALQADDNAFKTTYQTADTAARMALQADDNAFKTTYQAADTAAKKALLDTDNAFKAAYQTADTTAKKELQAAHDTVMQEVAKVEADYKTLMQTSTSASAIYQTTMSNIQAIFADKSIPASDKATVINGYLGWMKQGMNVVGSTTGVDLTGLTDFGTVTA